MANSIAPFHSLSDWIVLGKTDAVNHIYPSNLNPFDGFSERMILCNSVWIRSCVMILKRSEFLANAFDDWNLQCETPTVWKSEWHATCEEGHH